MTIQLALNRFDRRVPNGFDGPVIELEINSPEVKSQHLYWCCLDLFDKIDLFQEVSEVSDHQVFHDIRLLKWSLIKRHDEGDEYSQITINITGWGIFSCLH